MILYLREATQLDVETLRTGTYKPPAAPPPAKAGFFSRLFAGPAPAPSAAVGTGNAVQEFFFADPGSGNVVDFDRGWDALNMMLTGEPFGNEGPLAIFYHQGDEIGPDAGYGPARYIPAGKMREFAEALQNLGDDELAARFDPAGFEAGQLYASYLFSEDGIGVDYIMQWMPSFRKFADRCAGDDAGALVAIY